MQTRAPPQVPLISLCERAAGEGAVAGQYIANRASDKLTKISDNVYVCRSGSAADTQALADMVKNYIRQHK